MKKLNYVVTRTPLRVSFFGGGTDISYFYKKYNGRVISTTINRFVYVTVKTYDRMFGEKYRLNYSQTEHVKKKIKRYQKQHNKRMSKIFKN